VLTKLGERLLTHAADFTVAIQAEFTPRAGRGTVRTAKVRLSRV
jgi:hypothetical protein